MLLIVFGSALVALGAALTAYVSYQTLLFAADAVLPDPAGVIPVRARRINVVVPAHNEEMYLPRLLESLRVQDYPAGSYQVTVVADNCTDGTVAACERFAVSVLERNDATNRGKGHAIRWALEHDAVQASDAVVIVDGDSTVSANFLQALNVQMQRGDRVIQCYNGVANPGQSWFTRLMSVSRTISNDILHPAKRKLGLSSHLMGNGMCFDMAFLKVHGWNAFSVGEDWEYYARLILSGDYVGYSRDARVFHQESVNLTQASSQRMRWSSGRIQVLRQFGPALLQNALRRRDWRSIDAALPLVFPNPSLGVNLTIGGLLLALTYALVGGGSALLWWFTALLGAQLLMFMIGVLHTPDRLASAASIVLAPAFLAWKMAIDLLSLAGVGRSEWKRTERRVS